MRDVTVLRARLVFPIVAAPIADGYVAFRAGQILAVGRQKKSGDKIAADLPSGCEIEVRDFGNAAILPGLVNTHTHLDFSDLAVPLGWQGVAFTDWLRLVLEYRRSATNEPYKNVSKGMAESLRWGVTTLGDVVQPAWRPEAPPPSLIAFRELIAPTAKHVAGALADAEAHLRLSEKHSPGPWQAALCPHAPYTVHLALLAEVIKLSRANHVLLAMHLAETREEIELLQSGGGPLRTLLQERGVWPPENFATPRRPLDYLTRLATAHRALVIHGNYLDDEEITFLGANASRLSVVYCPRSHDWFDHAPYPLGKMLQAGVRVALGSDGRGSTPDLNLLADVRQAAERHPHVPLEKIFHLGTIYAAEALERESLVGSLAPGKQADLAVFALPEHDANDPYQLLLEAGGPPIACYWQGRLIGFSPSIA